jgi:hypothetical protein
MPFPNLLEIHWPFICSSLWRSHDEQLKSNMRDCGGPSRHTAWPNIPDVELAFEGP